MLQSIRERSQSWIAKVIVGAVIVALALFGVESLIGLFTNSGDDAAKVNGQSISRQQVERSVQRAIRSGQVPPEQERALRGQVLDQMIVQQLMTSYAEDGGLALSEGQSDQLIVNLPQFHNDEGKFDSDLYKQRLQQMGYTPLSFREQLRLDVLHQQVQQGLAASDFTLEGEQQRMLALQSQSRTFRYHTLTADDLQAPVEVSESEESAYYAEHQQEFQRPEQVQLNYVVLDRAELVDSVEVSEDELRTAWEQQQAEAPRTVSHVMVAFGGDRSHEQAMAVMDEVKQRLADGDSFADLAKEYSDDSGTADNGGDLGELVRGALGEQAFDDAAFALGEGEVSDVVETDSALHLIKVTSIESQPFDEVRDQLRQQVAASQVDGAFNDKAQRLIDESYAADDLASVAEDLGLELQQSDWVSRDGQEGVLAEPGVMDAAFGSEVLDDGYNSEVIDLDDDRRLVLRVADHREATTLPLEQVKEQVQASVRSDKTRKALLALAEERIEQLKADSAPEMDWQRADKAMRQRSNLSAAVLNTAFRLPHPETDSVVYGRAVDGDEVTLVALENVGQGEVTEQMKEQFSNIGLDVRRRSAVQGWVEYLQDTGDIERLQ
ncbi:SurA N-terminal domain-containing protein [Halomonas huangheensis]|uniref:Periplasmic chaperone PpiD n=1 Tax=Halomonas huangheensis TaxID=1178482 RepID=W1NC13_9GAMM|nr:SurA N-terminal domain-containing protein [Halomonas huangheensis]ALM52484.1 peptidylprolyl isomerase [Halomonas huangheensis]ERL53018.1 hypothetical protein BJB45_17210 [Halomonas huangheensis]